MHALPAFEGKQGREPGKRGGLGVVNAMWRTLSPWINKLAFNPAWSDAWKDKFGDEEPLL
jgi:hypothetical protein